MREYERMLDLAILLGGEQAEIELGIKPLPPYIAEILNNPTKTEIDKRPRRVIFASTPNAMGSAFRARFLARDEVVDVPMKPK